MASIDSLRASDGSENAAVATVQSVRAPLASTIVVDTVQGINGTFHATMGTPHTFVDPVTSETITVISEATAVDFKGHVDGGNLEIDTIAPGYTDNGSAVNDIVIIKPTTQWADEVADVLDVVHNDDGTLKDNVVNTADIVDDAVTAPKISGLDKSNLTVDSNPYKFRAYRTGNQSMPGASAFTKIQLNSEDFDTNNNFDSTTNYRYTAPVDGFYCFQGAVTSAPTAGDSHSCYLYKNGSAIARGNALVVYVTFTHTFVVTTMIKLVAGDYIELYYQNGAPGAHNVNGNSNQTFLSGFLVSRT